MHAWLTQAAFLWLKSTSVAVVEVGVKQTRITPRMKTIGWRIFILLFIGSSTPKWSQSDYTTWWWHQWHEGSTNETKKGSHQLLCQLWRFIQNKWRSSERKWRCLIVFDEPWKKDKSIFDVFKLSNVYVYWMVSEASGGQKYKLHILRKIKIWPSIISSFLIIFIFKVLFSQLWCWLHNNLLA